MKRVNIYIECVREKKRNRTKKIKERQDVKRGNNVLGEGGRRRTEIKNG